jgi:uncharacterized protein
MKRLKESSSPKKLAVHRARVLMAVALLYAFNLNGFTEETKQATTPNPERALAELRALAERGDGGAEFELALRYAKGEGVAQDFKEVHRWLSKAGEHGAIKEELFRELFRYCRGAAERGEAEAQFILANCYRVGVGVDKNRAEGLKWLQKAAEQGLSNAQLALGLNYECGEGVAEDKGEAVKLYRKAADQGNADAQYNLGSAYDKGNGVPQDFSEALKWYRRAADHGNRHAYCAVGEMYMKGRGGVTQDSVEAARWFCKAYDEGDGYAIVTLLYPLGYGSLPDGLDESKVIAFYAAAAEHGVAKQQYFMGTHYISKGDYEKALQYLGKAAEQNCTEAQYALGRMYEQGQGTPQNFVKAAVWYGKAAEQGSTVAQIRLGMCYLLGHGVEENHLEAYKWESLAAASGNEISVKSRDLILKELTSEQIAEGQRRAAAFVPKESDSEKLLRKAKEEPAAAFLEVYYENLARNIMKDAEKKL